MKNQSTVSTTPARSGAGARLVNRLERGLDCWSLEFEGRSTVIRHSRGLLLLAHLLARPNSGFIHGLQLAALVAPGPIARAPVEFSMPEGAMRALVTTTARVSQRALKRENLESLRLLRKRVKELEGVLDDSSESEVVRAEAEEELHALRQAQRDLWKTKEDAPRLSVRAVRRAIWRTLKGMARAVDHRGEPIPVLRDLARHLLVPSSRYHGPGASFAREEMAGCFQYTPPKGVRWIVH